MQASAWQPDSPSCASPPPLQEGVQEMRALGIRPDWQTYAIMLRAAAGKLAAAPAACMQEAT